MRVHILRGALAALLVLGLSLVAFAAEGELADQQILRYATDARSLPSLDPILGGTNATFPIQNMVFESLIRYQPGNPSLADIEPALAESWEVSEDGIVWTFYLRQGVMFHHGYGEFTSEDVVFSFDRARDLEGPSIFASKYAAIETIEAIGRYEVRFTLNKSDAFFQLTVLNKFAGWLVCKAAVLDLGEEFSNSPVGTGPFMVDSLIPGEEVILVRNSDYWRGQPTIERVEYYLMPDSTARTLALLTGEVDAVRGVVSPEWLAQVEGAGMQVGYSSPGQMVLFFNLTVKPLDDLRVRQAIAYALGRERILAFYGGTAIAMPSPVPPFVAGTLTESEIPAELLYKRDLDHARVLLAEAGYADGLTIETIISEHPDYLKPMQVWQELLKDVGIDLQLTVVDHSTYHSRIRSEQIPLIAYGGVRDPIPDVWLYNWYDSRTIIGKPGAITNFSHYGEVDADGDGTIDSIDALIDTARGTVVSEEQIAAWKAAQLQLLEDLPAFPSHMVKILFAWQPYVDLGYDLEGTVVDGIEIWETTRILKH